MYKLYHTLKYFVEVYAILAYVHTHLFVYHNLKRRKPPSFSEYRRLFSSSLP